MNLTSYATFQSRGGGGRFAAKDIEESVLAGITQWAEKVLAAAQGYCPVRSGELRASGRVEIRSQGSRAAAAVVFTAPHSVFVEFGVGIRGSSGPDAGPGPYSTTVKGFAAIPYLRPALDQLKGEAPGIVKAAVTVALG